MLSEKPAKQTGRCCHIDASNVEVIIRRTEITLTETAQYAAATLLQPTEERPRCFEAIEDRGLGIAPLTHPSQQTVQDRPDNWQLTIRRFGRGRTSPAKALVFIPGDPEATDGAVKMLSSRRALDDRDRHSRFQLHIFGQLNINQFMLSST